MDDGRRNRLHSRGLQGSMIPSGKGKLSRNGMKQPINEMVESVGKLFYHVFMMHEKVSASFR